MTPEFPRPVKLERITATHPLDVTVEATPEECRAVATRLRIVGVERLRCGFTLRRAADRIVADGRLEAVVTQDCVVSLEPFQAALDEAFVVHFVPAGAECEDDDPLAPDEIVYTGGVIDLGEAAVEQLALSLDPYPRRPGAAVPEAAADPAITRPFAALDRLRRQ